MIEKELRRRVEESIYFTKDRLLQYQQSHSPVVNDIDFGHTWSIKYKGYNHNMVYTDIHFYQTLGMKYQWFKNTKPKFDVDNMYSLVSKQLIYPVLFFLDGKFQRWTNIDIIPELKNTTYVIIKNMYHEKRNLPLDSVLIPMNNILYMEDPTPIEVLEIKRVTKQVICFDKNGYFIPEEDTSRVVSTILGFYDEHKLAMDTSTTLNTVNGVDYYLVNRDVFGNEYIGNQANLVFDKDNKFINNIDDKLTFVGDNVFRLSSDLEKDSINKIYTFVWKTGYEFATNMPQKIGSKNSELVTEYNSMSGKTIDYFNHELNGKTWDWFNTDYETNIRNAVRSILEYDPSILKKAYLDKSKVFTEEYTVGEMIKKYADSTGDCHIPRKRQGLINNSLMVFIDGDLYSQHLSIDDTTNDFVVPMNKYADYSSSDVELLFFTDTQNSVYDLTISSPDQEVHIPPDINPEYLQIFYPLKEKRGICMIDEEIRSDLSSTYRIIDSISEGEHLLYDPDNSDHDWTRIYHIRTRVYGFIPTASIYREETDYKDYSNFEYDIRPNEFSYLPVDFTLEKVTNEIYKVKFTDERLYGRSFKLVSRRQFRHNTIRWDLDTSDYHIYLDEKFNYVTDDEAFMVFINHKKINRENYIVTIPKETRPFDRPILELTTFLDKDDTVDIFYLPQSIKTVSLGDNEDYKPLAFLLSRKDDNFVYNLSKDLQFFFVNGRKICKKYIHDVSAEHVVISKTHSNYNLNIVYHIEGFKLVNEIYRELITSEYIRRIMGRMYLNLDGKTYSNNTKLLNELGIKMIEDGKFIFKDIEEDIQKHHADIKALINNVVMEYYADHGIETNKAFIFDVATQFLEEFKENTHVEYEKKLNNTTNKVVNGRKLSDSPTDEDEVYCIDLFNQEGLLKYDIRTDHIDDQTI